MRSTTWPRLRTTALVLAVAAGLIPTPAFAQSDGEGDGEPRVRDLIYRQRSLDGTESVDRSNEETRLTLAADVLFEFDSDALSAEAQSRLAALAAELGELGPRAVAVEGHSDSVGEATYNVDLSRRRADAVRAVLARELGGGFTFETTGHGDTRPIAPNENEDGSDNPEGRARNRRVEITYPNG